MHPKSRLTRSDWIHVALQSLVVAAGGMAISLLGAHLILSVFSAGLDRTGTIVSIILPLLLGGPVALVFTIQNARLREAYRRLEAAAARDSLTACLNHGAFIAQTNEFLNGSPRRETRGALLVVDADHFKSVNDRYGHHIGDAALRQIAARIQGAVRQGDLVGRLGGEEFGVFLPGSTQAIAESIAETIRRTVQTIEFEVEGNCFSLSVSVGGAVFESSVDYGELFRSADKKLYKVKNSGRNNVALMHLPVPDLDDSVLLKAG